MFRFNKEMFIVLLSVCTIVNFGELLAFTYNEAVKCVSPNNQPYKATSTIVNINSDKTPFYPSTVSVNKGSGSCNTIGDSYARVCVLNKVKNMNVKVFNLI